MTVYDPQTKCLEAGPARQAQHRDYYPEGIEQVSFGWPAEREQALPPSENNRLALNSFGADCVAAPRTDTIRTTTVEIS